MLLALGIDREESFKMLARRELIKDISLWILRTDLKLSLNYCLVKILYHFSKCNNIYFSGCYCVCDID